MRHDNTVTWLAYWKDPVNDSQYKYVWLAANSSFKSDSDLAKYEKARKLKDYIGPIRRVADPTLSSAADKALVGSGGALRSRLRRTRVIPAVTEWSSHRARQAGSRGKQRTRVKALSLHPRFLGYFRLFLTSRPSVGIHSSDGSTMLC